MVVNDETRERKLVRKIARKSSVSESAKGEREEGMREGGKRMLTVGQ